MGDDPVETAPAEAEVHESEELEPQVVVGCKGDPEGDGDQRKAPAPHAEAENWSEDWIPCFHVVETWRRSGGLGRRGASSEISGRALHALEIPRSNRMVAAARSGAAATDGSGSAECGETGEAAWGGR